MARMEMTWDEVKRRMKNGATVKTISELNGVSEQTIYNFINKNKEAEAGVPEMLAPVEQVNEEKKLLVDRDVYEEFTNIRQRIDMELEATCQKMDILKAKLAQVEQVIELIGIKGDES